MRKKTLRRIEKTVLNLLKTSNMEVTTAEMIRDAASKELGLMLSQPDQKQFIRDVIQGYIDQQTPGPGHDDDQQTPGPDDDQQMPGPDDGIIVCNLSRKRKVTVQAYKGKTQVSIREYYSNDDNDLHSKRGINLTTEQWSSLKMNMTAIDEAVGTMESRLNR